MKALLDSSGPGLAKAHTTPRTMAAKSPANDFEKTLTTTSEPEKPDDGSSEVPASGTDLSANFRSLTGFFSNLPSLPSVPRQHREPFARADPMFRVIAIEVPVEEDPAVSNGDEVLREKGDNTELQATMPSVEEEPTKEGYLFAVSRRDLVGGHQGSEGAEQAQFETHDEQMADAAEMSADTASAPLVAMADAPDTPAGIVAAPSIVSALAAPSPALGKEGRLPNLKEAEPTAQEEVGSSAIPPLDGAGEEQAASQAREKPAAHAIGASGFGSADESGRSGSNLPGGEPAAVVRVVQMQNFPAPLQPVSTGTMASLVEGVASSSEWTALTQQPAALQSVRLNAQGAPVKSLTIQLHPAELGMVTAKLHGSGEELSVELHVEKPEAYKQLTADSDAILKAFRSIGIEIEKVTILQPQTPTATTARSDLGSQGGMAQDSGFSPSGGAQQDSGRSGHPHQGRRGADAEPVSQGQAQPGNIRSDNGVYI